MYGKDNHNTDILASAEEDSTPGGKEMQGPGASRDPAARDVQDGLGSVRNRFIG